MNIALLLATMAMTIHGLVAAPTISALPELQHALETFDNGRDFVIDATVIVPPSTTNKTKFVVSDGLTSVSAYTTHTNREINPKRGDRIRLHGFTKPWTKFRHTSANCRDIRILGHQNLPEPPLVDFEKLSTPSHFGEYISVQGTVIDHFADEIDNGFAYLAIMNCGKVLYAAYQVEHADEIHRRVTVGSEVFMHVVCSGPSGISTLLQSSQLMIVDPSSIRTIRPAPNGLFSAITDTPSTNGVPHPRLEIRLQRVSGRVLTKWQGNMILVQTADDQLVRVELTGCTMPDVGDRIEAVGTTGVDRVRMLLTRSQWRPLPPDTTAPPTTPIDISLAELLHNQHGYRLLDPRHEGQCLHTRGIVKARLQNANGYGRLLITDGNDSLQIDCTEIPDLFAELVEGSLLDVTGICVLETEPWHSGTTHPNVYGFLLVPRNDRDIRVIDTPPWWTPARLAWALAIMLCFLIGALIVIYCLQRAVSRRTRLAIKAQRLQLESQSRLAERTRLAAELHDYHAQNLTAISYQLSAARNALAAHHDDAPDCLATAANMLKSCRTELRRALWDLRNDALDERDFNASVVKATQPVAGAAKLIVRFDIHRSRFDDVTAHTILSIVRELVANAVNHGHASIIRIAGCSLPDEISLSVSDNGVGFTPDHYPGLNEGHFGLEGIAARARHFEGTVKIESQPGHGARIAVTLKPQLHELV